MTIAFQADASGFVAILGFFNIVYAFLADKFIFDETMQGVQLTCALLILAITVALAIRRIQKQNQAKAAEKEEQSLEE